MYCKFTFTHLEAIEESCYIRIIFQKLLKEPPILILWVGGTWHDVCTSLLRNIDLHVDT